MPRFYVEKDGEWNIFSTIVDGFVFDEFVCLDALKARLLYERYKELTDDIDSLLTDKPSVNVMDYEEAVKRCREQTEPKTEGIWNAGYKTGYDKGYKDAQKVKDAQDLVKDLVKAFGEDGTWLERQGVYTLTLAEAKQRAVDIIESVIAKDEPKEIRSNLEPFRVGEPQTDCAWMKGE